MIKRFEKIASVIEDTLLQALRSRVSGKAVLHWRSEEVPSRISACGYHCERPGTQA